MPLRINKLDLETLQKLLRESGDAVVWCHDRKKKIYIGLFMFSYRSSHNFVTVPRHIDSYEEERELYQEIFDDLKELVWKTIKYLEYLGI